MSALEWTADRFRLYPASGPVSAGIQFHPSAIFHATRGVCFLLYTHWFYNIMFTYYPTCHNGKFWSIVSAAWNYCNLRKIVKHLILILACDYNISYIMDGIYSNLEHRFTIKHSNIMLPPLCAHDASCIDWLSRVTCIKNEITIWAKAAVNLFSHVTKRSNHCWLWEFCCYWLIAQMEKKNHE